MTTTPDYMAVRSGSSVTSQFSGGATTLGMSDADGNTYTFFAGSDSTGAYKGVAINYGPNFSAADQQRARSFATGFLQDHLDDFQDAAGHWNRTLIEEKPSLDITA